MTSVTCRPPKTRADLDALPEDVRAELIRGEIYVTPSPLDVHQRVSLRLIVLLDAWVRAEQSGRLRHAPLDVHLPSGDIVQPDLVFVASDNVGIMKRDGIHGVPDLAVEIISPTHPERDRIVKRTIYAENGVTEYWMVEPAEGAIEAFRLERGVYQPAGWFRGGEVLRSPGFEGLEIPIDEVFEG